MGSIPDGCLESAESASAHPKVISACSKPLGRTMRTCQSGTTKQEHHMTTTKTSQPTRIDPAIVDGSVQGLAEVDPLADVIPGTSNDVRPNRTAGGFCAPLWRLIVTSEFGDRFHPVLQTQRFHRGVDYGARSGTPVRAAAGGTVVWASDLGPYGTLVVIEHEPDLHTAYGHLQSTKVTVGERVRSGQRIGKVGSTGLATGPHLHFELRDNGTPRNPVEWISGGLSVGRAISDVIESRVG